MIRPEAAGAPLDRRNAGVLLGGVAALMVGYGALAMPPADGWVSRDLAPLLLAAGYVVLLPLGLALPPQRPAAR